MDDARLVSLKGYCEEPGLSMGSAVGEAVEDFTSDIGGGAAGNNIDVLFSKHSHCSVTYLGTPMAHSLFR